MSFKVAAFAFFALSLAAVSGRPQTGLFDCAGRPDGSYPDPFDRKGFYVCLEEDSVGRFECEADEVFDQVLGNCVLENEEEEQKELSAFENEETDSVKEELPELFEDEEVNNPGQRPPQRPPQGPRRPRFKVVNVQVTKNIFPKSILLIGKANREQKNK